MPRAVVLAEAHLGTPPGKTANGLVLHSVADPVVCVIDSTQAGRDAGEVVCGRPLGIPVVASLDQALLHDPETLYIGVANPGGFFPPGFEDAIEEALRAGLDVVNGLHRFLSEEERFATAASSGGAKILDVRKVPERLRVMDGSVTELDVPRVVIAGMDCDIGKRITAIEMLREMRSRGMDAGFVATGQTGCMLGPDAGCVIDRLPGDFAAGEVERMVVDVARRGKELVLLYSQASIRHPAFSGVALSVLHGAAPNAVILQVAPGRVQRALFSHPSFTIGDIATEIDLIETLGGAKVVALAVNPMHLERGEVGEVCSRLEEEFGIPAEDPLTGDVGRLVDAVSAHLATLPTYRTVALSAPRPPRPDPGP
ncbi:MAG: DUF1611 domain-containing protein [Euryarchaeota archaeon]|nr:DUF1611 domain-containing protein [Euryarchaeota archaeon]